MDAYFEDLEKIGEIAKEQLGFVPCFIRFPGGASNLVSAQYCKGIMSELVNLVKEKDISIMTGILTAATEREKEKMN